MEYQEILNTIGNSLKNKDLGGELATYIPELSNMPPDKFGIHLYTLEGDEYFYGDYQDKFTIQSISKVLTFSLAYINLGDRIFQRVGVEPSGNPFNSLTQLDKDNGIPRNPYINSGALVVADILLSYFDNPKQAFLDFVRKIAEDDKIDYDLNVMRSESKTGFRNIALANYIKSLGNIKNNVEDVLDFYFHQCSLSMTCQQLSKTFILYVNKGKLLNTGEQIIGELGAKRINAIMQTCGFYDEAGEFAYRVGLPGKSGVGGGIVAVRPRQYAVTVWSPLLNDKGNSMKGMKALEELTRLTNTSIF